MIRMYALRLILSVGYSLALFPCLVFANNWNTLCVIVKPEYSHAISADNGGTVQHNNDSIQYHIAQGEEFEHSDIYSAVEHYRNAIRLLEKGDQVLVQAKVYRKLGNAYGLIASSRHMAVCYINAYKLARQSGDKYEWALALNNIGDMYRKNGQNDFALKQYKRAQKVIGNRRSNLVCDSDFPILSARTKINMALAYYVAQHYDLALSLLREVIEVSGCGDRLQFGRANHNLAWIYTEEGHYDEASKFMNQALQIYDISKDSISWMYITLDLADLQLRKGLFKDSEELLTQVAERATRTGYENVIYMAWLQKVKLYKVLGNADSTAKYQKLFDNKVDQYYSRKNMRAITETMLLFEADERDQKIGKISKEKELADERTLSFMLHNQLLALILIAVSISMVVILYYLRKQKRANEELVKKYLRTMNGVDIRSQQNQSKSYTKEKYSGSPLNKDLKTDLINKLEEKMNIDKVYLNANFSLICLSEMLEVNRTYLSQSVNEHYGISFNQLIASIRVKEACRKLIHPEYQKYTVAGIGELCGFGSSFGFTRTFKNETGITPSAFQKTALRQLHDTSTEMPEIEMLLHDKDLPESKISKNQGQIV
jgi:AraC-like DNA-binding protein